MIIYTHYIRLFACYIIHMQSVDALYVILKSIKCRGSSTLAFHFVLERPGIKTRNAAWHASDCWRASILPFVRSQLASVFFFFFYLCFIPLSVTIVFAVVVYWCSLNERPFLKELYCSSYISLFQLCLYRLWFMKAFKDLFCFAYWFMVMSNILSSRLIHDFIVLGHTLH